MIMEANKSEDVLQTTVEEITQCLRAQVQRSAEETAWRKGTVDQLKTAMIELAKQPQPRTGPSEMPPPRRRHRATDTRQPVAASAKQKRAADKERKLKRALQEATAQAIGSNIFSDTISSEGGMESGAGGGVVGGGIFR
jgi:hypothetical protein